jgi:hypothetical protein
MVTLHPLLGTNPDLLEILKLKHMEKYLQVCPAFGTHHGIITMTISGKVSTVYSNCIQVELGSFWKIPISSIDWRTTCMNTNVQKPIPFEDIQDVYTKYVSFRQEVILNKSDQVVINLNFDTLQLLHMPN